jgi:hypothetical protein
MHSTEQTKLMNSGLGDTPAKRAKAVADMIRAARQDARATFPVRTVGARNMLVRLKVRAQLREQYGIVWRPR